MGSDRFQSFLQTGFPAIQPNHLYLGTTQRNLRRDQIKPLDLRFQDGSFQRDFFQQDRVKTFFDLLFVDPQAAGGIRLRVQIDEKNTEVGKRQLAG